MISYFVHLRWPRTPPPPPPLEPILLDEISLELEQDFCRVSESMTGYTLVLSICVIFIKPFPLAAIHIKRCRPKDTSSVVNEISPRYLLDISATLARGYYALPPCDLSHFIIIALRTYRISTLRGLQCMNRCIL